MEIAELVSDELRSWIGREAGPVELPEEISGSDVRRFITSTGDRNPLWTELEVAKAAGYPRCPVPPMLIYELYRRGEGSEGAGDGNLWPGIPMPAGYTGNGRNAGVEMEWLAPVYVGDRLSIRYRLVDIYAKQTRRGPAIFTVRQAEFVRQDGEVALRTIGTGVRLPPSKADDEQGGHGA